MNWGQILLTIFSFGAVAVVFWAYTTWKNLRVKYLKTTVNEKIGAPVNLLIAVPRKNEKSPLSAEQLFASLHGIGLNKTKALDHFSLEIVAGSYGVHFMVSTDQRYKQFVENQIYAQYPEAQITPVSDYVPQIGSNQRKVMVRELTLMKDYYLPIRTFTNFDVDPLAGITGALSSLAADQEIFIQILCRPLSDSWQEKGKKYVDERRNQKDSEGKKVQLESGESEMLGAIERKNSKSGYQFVVRILVQGKDDFMVQRLIDEVTAAFGQYRTAVFNSLGTPESKKLKGWDKFVDDIKSNINTKLMGKRQGEILSPVQKYQNRFLDEFTTGILNTEELASLYHLPNKSVETPNIAWAKSKKLEYPLGLPNHHDGARLLGITDYRGVHLPFGIKSKDRLRHMYIIGKTGVGKSTLIEGMILSDIYDGSGVGVIDPHGELIKQIMERIPQHRMQDVIIFDPGDVEYPIGFNLLQTNAQEDKSLIADGIISVFKKEFANSWGPRLEYILTNSVLTLLHCQNVSLLVLPRLLADTNYRQFLLKQIKDPLILKFWVEEYEQIAKDPRRRSEETSSILNKVGRFTTNPLIRNIIGQVSSSFDLKEVMDNKKILLVNLSQGKIGEENMSFLGSMLVNRIYSNVTRRINEDPDKRTPFYLYIDEFQNFSTSTFAKILSEARKFGLSLTVAHQFIDQLSEEIRNAIFGNVGTIINFSIGPRDADFLIKEFTPYLQPEDLVNLGKSQIVTKLSVDSAQSKPFTAKTLLHNFPITGLYEQVWHNSRRTHSKPRDEIEKKLYKWASQQYNKEGNLAQPGEIIAKPDKEKSFKKDYSKPYDKEKSDVPRNPKPREARDNKDVNPERRQARSEYKPKSSVAEGGDRPKPTTPSTKPRTEGSPKTSSGNPIRARSEGTPTSNSNADRTGGENNKQSKPAFKPREGSRETAQPNKPTAAAKPELTKPATNTATPAQPAQSQPTQPVAPKPPTTPQPESEG